jgi:hypothetical protein
VTPLTPGPGTVASLLPPLTIASPRTFEDWSSMTSTIVEQQQPACAIAGTGTGGERRRSEHGVRSLPPLPLSPT